MAAPTRALRRLVGPVLAALAVGCAGVLPKPPAPTPASFILAPDLASMPSANRTPAPGPTLLVSRPEPSAGYGTARMAYLERDYRLDYSAAMLEPLLVQALGAHPAFGAVSANGRGIRADLRLDTVIEAFYQDFRARPSQVRVALRVRLVDPGDGRILATRLFDLTEPAPADAAYGGVQAINRALARLLPEVAAFAARAAPRQVMAP